MSSRRIVDLRKRKAGLSTRPLALPDAPKRETLRMRRTRMRVLFALSLGALFVVAIYGASVLSYLPQFSIERIEVRGTNYIRPALVQAFVATKLWDGSPSFFSESNSILFPRERIEAALKDFFPRIESAKISRESLLANAITVVIEERKPFARWCLDTAECYAMDEGGFIFSPASVIPRFETVYEFKGPLSNNESPIGKTYLPGRFAGVVALLERLGQAGFSPEGVSIEGEQDFSVLLAEGFQLRVSFGADIATTIKNLELVLSSEALRGRQNELEYIDLRFGNRVYYKFRGGEKEEF